MFLTSLHCFLPLSVIHSSTFFPSLYFPSIHGLRPLQLSPSPLAAVALSLFFYGQTYHFCISSFWSLLNPPQSGFCFHFSIEIAPYLELNVYLRIWQWWLPCLSSWNSFLGFYLIFLPWFFCVLWMFLFNFSCDFASACS